MYSFIFASFLAVVVVIFVWKHVLYPALFSPLASVPAAHPLVHITSLWIQWQRFRGVEHECITEAFLKKGSYVRLGPQELAVNDIDAVRNGWGVREANFDKHSSYRFFMTHGTPNTFTTLLSEDHHHHRRRLRTVYSHAFLLASPHMRAILVSVVRDRVRPFLALKSSSPEGIIDLMPLAQSYVLDYVSAFSFGLPLSLHLTSNIAAHRHWTGLYNTGFPSGMVGFWLQEYPRITMLLSKMGVPILSSAYHEARRALETWALQKVEAAEDMLQRYDKEKGLAAGTLPVLYNAVRAGMAKADGLSDEIFSPSPSQRLELASECLDHIASTGETFGTTFTYMVYELSRHMDVQTELRKELQSINNPFYDGINLTDLPESETLERLPFLDAVIKESLRLRNTSPSLSPRVSPANCNSHFGRIPNLPPGTRVGAYSWWLHRNPDVYPNPESWIPDRWLGKDFQEISILNKWFFAFGGGSRDCIGKPIAMELLRMGLAAIYSSYTTSISDDSEYPGAAKAMSGACTERLLIRFEKLST